MYEIRTQKTLYRFGKFSKAVAKFEKLWRQRQKAEMWLLDKNCRKIKRIGAIWKDNTQVKKWNFYIEMEEK